jgi:hypothetical protein
LSKTFIILRHYLVVEEKSLLLPRSADRGKPKPNSRLMAGATGEESIMEVLNEMFALADQLDAQAAICDTYRLALERAIIAGTVGSLRRKAVLTCAVYRRTAAGKRRRAAELRAQAARLA